MKSHKCIMKVCENFIKKWIGKQQQFIALALILYISWAQHCWATDQGKNFNNNEFNNQIDENVSKDLSSKFVDDKLVNETKGNNLTEDDFTNDEDDVDESGFSGPGGVIKDYVPIGNDLVSSIAMQSRVIGGRTAHPGEFPYLVSVQYGIGHSCGGSIISPTWILTAAHCVKVNQPNSYSVQPNYDNQRTRAYNKKIYRVKRILMPRRRNEFSDDLALLKLTEPIPLSGNLAAVKLPSGPPPIGKRVTVAGWGLMGNKRTQILKTAEFPLHSPATCKRVFKRLYLDGMICAGVKGIDACPGDSGGPLVVRGKTPKDDVLIGVVSWGPVCGTSLGIYADIWHYRKFIENSDLDHPKDPYRFPWSKTSITRPTSLYRKSRPGRRREFYGSRLNNWRPMVSWRSLSEPTILKAPDRVVKETISG